MDSLLQLFSLHRLCAAHWWCNHYFYKVITVFTKVFGTQKGIYIFVTVEEWNESFCARSSALSPSCTTTLPHPEFCFNSICLLLFWSQVQLFLSLQEGIWIPWYIHNNWDAIPSKPAGRFEDSKECEYSGIINNRGELAGVRGNIFHGLHLFLYMNVRSGSI